MTSQWPSVANPGGAPFVKKEVEALRQAGVNVDVFLYTGGWSPSNYLRAVRQLHRQLDSKQYDLVHVRFGQSGLVGRAQWKLPVVITYGGSDIEGSPVFRGRHRYRNFVLIGVSRLLSLLADEVIVVSDHLGRKLPRRSYHIIPSGIDLDLFQPYDMQEARRKLNLPVDKKLVLFIGDPSKPTKRFELADRACQIAEEFIDLMLINIYKLPQTLVPWYMSACNALILTSTNEGSPNVVKEALACNLPVVAVDVGDIRERIGSNNSCAIATDSAEALSEALVRVLNIPLRPQLRDLVANITNEIWISEVVQVYEKTLTRKKPIGARKSH